MSSLELMKRDAELLGVAFAALAALIVAAVVILLLHGHTRERLAALSPVVGVAGWFAYYETDLDNPGLAGAAIGLAIIGFSAAALGVSTWSVSHRLIKLRRGQQGCATSPLDPPANAIPKR